MAVGAHADDNELHFGGTLLKYLDKGYEIVYCQATNNMSGSKRKEGKDGKMIPTSFGPAETMKYRKQECEEAAKIFRTTPIHLDHPQRHYKADSGKGEVRYGSPKPDGVPVDVPTILTAYEDEECVGALKELILEHDPEVIFTHAYAESNIEHYATTRLVVKAYWKAAENGFSGSLLMNVRGFTELGRIANVWETFVDIEGYLERRMEAVRKHVSQYPPTWEQGAQYWRNIIEHRGKVCGVKAADVFNFVNDPDESSDEGELLSELMRNRATESPWGWKRGWEEIY